ncbi:MAG: oligosaccharide flippase family protein [Anaerolineae bacterium]
MGSAVAEEAFLKSKSAEGFAIIALLGIVRFVVASGNYFVLGHLLSPDVFGTYAFCVVVVGFAALLTTVEGRRSVITATEKVDEVFTHALGIELALAVLVMAVIVVGSPSILWLLNRPEIPPAYLQLLSLQLLITPFELPLALLERRLAFRIIGVIEFVSILANCVISIGLAWRGWGVWSLVVSTVVSGWVRVLLGWLIVRPRLVRRLDGHVARQVVGYGLPLTLSNMIGHWYWNVDDLIVGYLLGTVELGYYWLAFKIPHYMLQLADTVSKVTFPVYARMPGDEGLERAFNWVTKLSAALLLLPAVLALPYGEFIIVTAFGEQWMPAVLTFQIYMSLVAFRGTLRHWADVAMVKGYNRVVLHVTASVGVLLPVLGYLVTLRYGIAGMAAAVALSLIVTSPLYLLRMHRWLGVRYLRILWPEVVTGVIVALLGILVHRLLPDRFIVNVLALAMLCGAYVGVLLVLDRPIVSLIGSEVRSRLVRRPV